MAVLNVCIDLMFTQRKCSERISRRITFYLVVDPTCILCVLLQPF